MELEKYKNIKKDSIMESDNARVNTAIMESAFMLQRLTVQVFVTIINWKEEKRIEMSDILHPSYSCTYHRVRSFKLSFPLGSKSSRTVPSRVVMTSSLVWNQILLLCPFHKEDNWRGVLGIFAKDINSNSDSSRIVIQQVYASISEKYLLVTLLSWHYCVKVSEVRRSFCIKLLIL